MNHKIILYFVGWVMRIEGILLLLPLAISIFYRESEWIYILTIAAACFIIGAAISWKKPTNTSFYTREGFVAVALGWIILCVLGAMPLYQTGCVESFVDAFFETVSGFTTTGASILPDVENIPKGVLFWRSFSHWVGGMGVLVFVLAFLPLAAGDGIHIMRAESPGPSVGKLVPKVKSTAKILYGIYVGITVIEIIVLCISGLPLFDSTLLTFGCVGTGGFGIKNDSAASYTTFQQGIITFFMIVCGVNFNVYFLFIGKQFKEAFSSEEVKAYLGILAFAAVTIAINVRNFFPNFFSSLHHSLFQVASCMTTTGFSTVDFDMWPTYSKITLLIVMFVGGCAGSTAGGLKVSRIVIAFKTIRKEMSSLIHPRSVKVLKFEGKVIEHSVLRSVNVYYMTYLLIFAISVLLISIDGKDVVTTITSVIATFNNIGPGLGGCGPATNYSQFGTFAKWVLSFDMLAGRLELFPILLLFTSRTWKNQL